MTRAIRLTLLGVLGLLTLAAAGCRGGGSYPVDLFNEMHYQQSQRIQEPDRLDSPAGAVSINRGNVPFAVPYADAATVKSPTAATEKDVAAGKQLFMVNCSQCHGLNADGQSEVANRLETATRIRPPPFNTDRVKNRPDGQVYWALTNGYPSINGAPATDIKQTNMPAFGHLLTDAQRWQLVAYIRSVK